MDDDADRDPAVIDVLAQRAQAGDDEAFDTLVLRLHRQVRLAIAAHACHAEQVEEILQASWVVAFERLSTYEPRGTFLPWVKGIARNLLRKDLEERIRHRRTSGGGLLESLVAQECAADLDDDGADGRSLRRVERLRRCLDGLPPRARMLILARDGAGEPLARMAVRFKQSREALATVLWRIRRGLRHCVERGEVEA